jgi:hypothetical protein
MQCKTFHIRLNSDHTAADEAALNQFLATVQVKQTFASVETTGLGDLFWLILIFYDPI